MVSESYVYFEFISHLHALASERCVLLFYRCALYIFLGLLLSLVFSYGGINRYITKNLLPKITTHPLTYLFINHPSFSPLLSSGDVSGRASVDHHLHQHPTTTTTTITTTTDAVSPPTTPQRLTPTLFPRAHTIVRFTPSGHLLMLKPSLHQHHQHHGSSRSLASSNGSSNNNAVTGTRITFVDIKKVLAANADIKQELQLIEAYPGPLTRLVIAEILTYLKNIPG